MATTDEDELQSLIPSLSPIMGSGMDPEAILASGNPMSYMAALRAGVPFNASPATAAPTAPPSQLAASMPPPSPAQQTPSPAGSAAIQGGENAPAARPSRFSRLASAVAPQVAATLAQPAAPTPQQPATMASTMPGIAQGLTENATPQLPANNAPNPPSEPTGTPAVPGTVTPSGAPQTAVPDLSAIEAQRAQAAAPQSATNPTGVPNPRDPNNPQYRPTKWQRVGRGVLGGVEGLARGGFRGALLGAVDPAAEGATAYGAPTRAFNSAFALNQQRQGSLEQQLQQGGATAEAALKEAQAQGLTLIPVTQQMADANPAFQPFVGTSMAPTEFKSVGAAAVRGQAQEDVAGQNNATKLDVEGDKEAAVKGLRDAQTEEAQAKAELARAGNDPNSPAYKLALKRATTASANAAAAQIRANAYALNATGANLGTDAAGNPLPGSTQTAGGTPVGSRFQGQYTKQQGNVARFNDVLGATDQLENTARALVRGGGSLSDPVVAAGMAEPKGTFGQWMQGQVANGSMTPAQRDYVTNMRAFRENLQALRQSVGGSVSDSQVDRLMQMAPGAQTPDLDYLLRQTGQIRATANRLAQGIPATTGGNQVHGASSGPPQSVVDGAKDGQYLHGPNGELFQKKDGKAVPVNKQ